MGPRGGGPPGMPPDLGGGPPDIPTDIEPGPGLDLGAEPEAISEKNLLSLHDDNAPIKVANNIRMVDKLLNEEKDDDEDNDLTEFEQWQKKAQTNYKVKRSKAQHKEDAGIENPLTIYQRTRSRASVDGLRSEQDKLKASADAKKIDEELNIEEYLDTKITQNAHMTNAIKSTLSRLKNNLNIDTKTIISENNSSGGNKND